MPKTMMERLQALASNDPNVVRLEIPFLKSLIRAGRFESVMQDQKNFWQNLPSVIDKMSFVHGRIFLQALFLNNPALKEHPKYSSILSDFLFTLDYVPDAYRWIFPLFSSRLSPYEVQKIMGNQLNFQDIKITMSVMDDLPISFLLSYSNRRFYPDTSLNEEMLFLMRLKLLQYKRGVLELDAVASDIIRGLSNTSDYSEEMVKQSINLFLFVLPHVKKDEFSSFLTTLSSFSDTTLSLNIKAKRALSFFKMIHYIMQKRPQIIALKPLLTLARNTLDVLSTLEHGTLGAESVHYQHEQSIVMGIMANFLKTLTDKNKMIPLVQMVIGYFKKGSAVLNEACLMALYIPGPHLAWRQEMTRQALVEGKSPQSAIRFYRAYCAYHHDFPDYLISKIMECVSALYFYETDDVIQAIIDTLISFIKNAGEDKLINSLIVFTKKKLEGYQKNDSVLVKKKVAEAFSTLIHFLPAESVVEHFPLEYPVAYDDQFCIALKHFECRPYVPRKVSKSYIGTAFKKTLTVQSNPMSILKLKAEVALLPVDDISLSLLSSLGRFLRKKLPDSLREQVSMMRQVLCEGFPEHRVDSSMVTDIYLESTACYDKATAVSLWLLFKKLLLVRTPNFHESNYQSILRTVLCFSIHRNPDIRGYGLSVFRGIKKTGCFKEPLVKEFLFFIKGKTEFDMQHVPYVIRKIRRSSKHTVLEKPYVRYRGALKTLAALNRYTAMSALNVLDTDMGLLYEKVIARLELLKKDYEKSISVTRLGWGWKNQLAFWFLQLERDDVLCFHTYRPGYVFHHYSPPQLRVIRLACFIEGLYEYLNETKSARLIADVESVRSVFPALISLSKMMRFQPYREKERKYISFEECKKAFPKLTKDEYDVIFPVDSQMQKSLIQPPPNPIDLVKKMLQTKITLNSDITINTIIFIHWKILRDRSLPVMLPNGGDLITVNMLLNTLKKDIKQLAETYHSLLSLLYSAIPTEGSITFQLSAIACLVEGLLKYLSRNNTPPVEEVLALKKGCEGIIDLAKYYPRCVKHAIRFFETQGVRTLHFSYLISDEKPEDAIVFDALHKEIGNIRKQYAGTLGIHRVGGGSTALIDGVIAHIDFLKGEDKLSQLLIVILGLIEHLKTPRWNIAFLKRLQPQRSHALLQLLEELEADYGELFLPMRQSKKQAIEQAKNSIESLSSPKTLTNGSQPMS